MTEPIIIDNFLKDPEFVRSWALRQAFKDFQSPVDAISYPDLCLDIHPILRSEIKKNIKELTGLSIGDNVMFMRLSKEGVQAPHKAHTDKIMGEYSLMVYLNRPEDCQGGTGFVRHVSGINRHPDSPEKEQMCHKDCNDESKWTLDQLCEMKFNRACLFPSEMFHMALPSNGFGTSLEDGRLVLISFFNTKESIC